MILNFYPSAPCFDAPLHVHATKLNFEVSVVFDRMSAPRSLSSSFVRSFKAFAFRGSRPTPRLWKNVLPRRAKDAYSTACRRHLSSFTLQGESNNGSLSVTLNRTSLEEKEEWLSSLIVSPSADAESFLVVLRELATCDRPDAPYRAERWLRQLEQINPEAVNSECYLCLIEAWSRASQVNPAVAVNRAERWLMKHIDSPIERLRPTTASFNAFLDVCSKGRALKQSKEKDYVRRLAEKAEGTLRYMINSPIYSPYVCISLRDRSCMRFATNTCLSMYVLQRHGFV